MSTTSRQINVFNDQNHSGKQLVNVALELLASDPTGAGLFEGRIYKNTVTGYVMQVTAGVAVALAKLSDITGGLRIQPVTIAASAATPSAGGVTGNLQNGFSYIVAGAPSSGITLAGANPAVPSHNGALVIYIGASGVAASSLNDWSAFTVLEQDAVVSTSVTSAATALVADTDVTVTLTGLTSITQYDVRSTTADSTGGFPSVKHGIYSSVVGNVVTLNSGIAMSVTVTADGVL